MRVGLSMLTLVPGVVGGSETYARALCKALAESGAVDATGVRADARAGRRRRPSHRRGRRVPRLDEQSGAACARWCAARSRRGRCSARLAGIDVVHYPLTVPVPPLDVPSVVTLHDVQHLDLPQLFSRGERLFRRVFYDRASRRADLVLVPSEFVRERAVARLGLDPARVLVCPHGVDHEAFRPGTPRTRALLLYPAKTWPHKNHERLLAAFALLRARSPELRLVLTGGGTEKLAGPPGVEARGLVPAAELAELYRRAACLVFPSLYEGFGTPILEAMACGTPGRGGAGRVAPRGLRRRGRALRPARPRGDRGRRPYRPLPQRRAPRARPCTRRRVHLGSVGGTARRCVRIR